ncbi:TPA: hypothetical protein N2A54_001437 [Pseudomonas aeruginosa]|nr:hypothetical protein [Pseudomonas aeruginosa]
MTTPRMIANSFRNYLAGYDCLVSISDTHEVTLQFSSHVNEVTLQFSSHVNPQENITIPGVALDLLASDEAVRRMSEVLHDEFALLLAGARRTPRIGRACS